MSVSVDLMYENWCPECHAGADELVRLRLALQTIILRCDENGARPMIAAIARDALDK